MFKGLSEGVDRSIGLAFSAAAFVCCLSPSFADEPEQYVEGAEKAFAAISANENDPDGKYFRPVPPIAAPAPEQRCYDALTSEKQVRVVFDVEPNGATENVRAQSDDIGCFEEASIAAISKWRYLPLPYAVNIARKGLIQDLIFARSSHD